MNYINIAIIAKKYATEKHKDQKRKDGEDYITHPIAVAKLVKKYKRSHNIDNLIAAAYLHDVLEDTDTSYNELVKVFGRSIANLVKEVTTNKEIKNILGKDKYLACKLKYMTNWALVIKLCDRLHNVLGLNLCDKKFKKRYIKETLFIINYITKSRELSDTHKKIIDDILNQLKKYDD